MSANKRLAYRQEKEIAQALGGQRQILSGAIPTMPGDVITEEFLIEAKTRGSTTTRGEKMITIHRSWLTKTQKDAERTGKKPVLVFKFKGDRTQWFIMNFDDLIEIAQTLREYREYFEQDPGE